MEFTLNRVTKELQGRTHPYAKNSDGYLELSKMVNHTTAR